VRGLEPLRGGARAVDPLDGVQDVAARSAEDQGVAAAQREALRRLGFVLPELEHGGGAHGEREHGEVATAVGPPIISVPVSASHSECHRAACTRSSPPVRPLASQPASEDVQYPPNINITCPREDSCSPADAYSLLGLVIPQLQVGRGDSLHRAEPRRVQLACHVVQRAAAAWWTPRHIDR
jgi:hypothetical protein